MGGVTRGTYAAAQWCAGFSSASPPHSSGSGYAASCSPVSLSPWIHLLGREEPKLVGPTSPGGFWRENKIPCQQIVSTAMKEPQRARHLLPDPNTNGRISHSGNLPNDKNLWRTSLRNTSDSWPTFSQPPVCPCVSTVCWPGLLAPALMYSQGRSSPASAEEQKVKSERDVRASDTQTSVKSLCVWVRRTAKPEVSVRFSVVLAGLQSLQWTLSKHYELVRSFERAPKGKTFKQ